MCEIMFDPDLQNFFLKTYPEQYNTRFLVESAQVYKVFNHMVFYVGAKQHAFKITQVKNMKRGLLQ